MGVWGPGVYGDPCHECGYVWSISFDEAVAVVAEIAGRYERLLEGLDGTQQHPANDWSARAYVCHVADNLRIWSERLVGAALDTVVHVAAYDESALGRIRSYGAVSTKAALWALEHAARDWTEAVDHAVAVHAVLVHPDGGELSVLDVVRGNAHDAVHHGWDIERSVTASMVRLVEYDPAWPDRYAVLRDRLATVLADLPATIEHVGSTSVSGLTAKPIIDIDVVVPRPDDLAAVIERLATAGWTHQGDGGVAGREMFDVPDGRPEDHHLYLVVAGSKPHLDHVQFRDLLRRDPASAARYVAEKRRHGHLLPDDRAGYTDAKADVIERLLIHARAVADQAVYDTSRFDDVAETYDARRPGYPSAVFDAIRAYGRWADLPKVLEVGIGTGQATTQMAALGWQVLGIEPGAQLAAIARQRLTTFAHVRVLTATFESAELESGDFDLVASATAWHWVDPHVGYDKAARSLRAGGTIALWWNAHVPDTDDVRWEPIRRTYEDVAPELAVLARLTPDRPDYDPAAELAASGWFSSIERHVFPFTVQYRPDEFVSLLDTYASHHELGDTRRGELYERLIRTIDVELDGAVTKPYEAELVLGRLVRSRDA
jgi:GrpB-like predicted nucleotidyltransferase (UPF0157 family)/SAM-dependent methyltransferase